MRRREASDIARKIVSGLSAHTLHNMVQCRQIYKQDQIALEAKEAKEAKAKLAKERAAAASCNDSTVATPPSDCGDTALAGSAGTSNPVQRKCSKQVGMDGDRDEDKELASSVPSLDDVDSYGSPIDVLTEVLVKIMIEDILDLEHQPAAIAVAAAAESQANRAAERAAAAAREKAGGAASVGGAAAAAGDKGKDVAARFSATGPGITMVSSISAEASATIAAADESHGDKVGLCCVALILPRELKNRANEKSFFRQQMSVRLSHLRASP